MRLQANITITGEEGVVSNNSSTQISSNRPLEEDLEAPKEARCNIKNRYNLNSSTRISSIRFSNNRISSKGRVVDAQITLTTILGASNSREMQTTTDSSSKDRRIKATTKRK